MISVDQRPYGTTIFCDDIREEIGGKFTYVGVYSSELRIAGEAPAVLPKFCASVRLIVPAEFEIAGVRIVISMAGADETKTILEQEMKIDLPERKPGTHLVVNYHHIFSPFEISETSRVKVRAYIGKEKIRLGTLALNFLPSEADVATDDATQPNP